MIGYNIAIGLRFSSHSLSIVYHLYFIYHLGVNNNEATTSKCIRKVEKDAFKHEGGKRIKYSWKGNIQTRYKNI